MPDAAVDAKISAPPGDQRVDRPLASRPDPRHDSRPDPRPDPRLPDHPLANGIDRSRYWLFIVIAILMLLAFNGQWRIGLDSADYRGLADSLANGRGYTFGTWAPKAIYPGLPLMLAALQKAFGASPLMPDILMNVMAAITLWVTYLLMKLCYPRWIAVAVTFAVGTNSWFLELANEILTDIPFLLGVMLALYGWELLRSNRDADRPTMLHPTMQHPAAERPPVSGPAVSGPAAERPTADRRAAERRVAARRAIPIVLLIVGLSLAGLTRPTFWIVVFAWGLVSLWGLVRGPRMLSAASLLIMAMVWITFLAVDPRSHGFHLVSGSPERQAISLLSEGPETVRVLNHNAALPAPTTGVQILWEKLRYVLHDQLPTSFFGQRVAPLSIVASLILLASSLFLWRRPLWLLLIWLTFAVTVLLSAEPRYYTMVLPLLALGWTLMCRRILILAPGRWGTLLVCGLMLLVEGNNVARDVPIIIEQRSRPFLEHYRKGEYIPLMALAERMHALLPPDANVLGPSGSVLSYFSGLHVWTQREILNTGARQRLREIDFPLRLQQLNFSAGIFPARHYWDKEPTIARLMDRRVIVATKVLAAIDRFNLASLEIRLPAGDWRKLPKPPPHVHHLPKHVHHKKKKHHATHSTTLPSEMPPPPRAAANAAKSSNPSGQP